MSELKQIRKEIRKQIITSILFNFLFLDTHIGLITRDYIDLYRFDRKKKKGKVQVPLPRQASVAGKNILDRYLKAYEEENPPPKPPHHPGWTCSCGRENQCYVSTCVCGKSKQDVSNKEK